MGAVGALLSADPGHRPGPHALAVSPLWPLSPSLSLLQSQKQIFLWIWACWKQVPVPGLPSHLWQNSAPESQTRGSAQSSWRPGLQVRTEVIPTPSQQAAPAGLSPYPSMKRSHLPRYLLTLSDDKLQSLPRLGAPQLPGGL